MIHQQRKEVNLPPRPFLYTLDQIATILSVSEQTVRNKYIYFVGRSIGVARASLLKARNLADPDKRPDWRVSEQELIRWMKTRGFKYTERGSFQ